MVWGVDEDLQAAWSLDFADNVLLASKAAPVRLGLAAQLAMYRRQESAERVRGGDKAG